jgi:hypothetical protein
MASEPGHRGRQACDRGFLLGEKRNELLTLAEVQQYGRDSFGDPDHVSIYGLKPHQWYARGVRILGRTAVECTPDRLAGLMGRDIAAVARAAAAAPPMVVDLFAGSGNTLSWIKRHTGARQAIGFELDDMVFQLARTNLRIAGLGIDLRHDSCQHGLASLGYPGEDLLVVFVFSPLGRCAQRGVMARPAPHAATGGPGRRRHHRCSRPPQAAVRDTCL